MTPQSSDAIAELDAHFAAQLIKFSTGVIARVHAGELTLTEARTMHDEAAALQQVARAAVHGVVDGFAGLEAGAA